MKHLRRLRPSPAMVVACIALTVALGGTSVAAINALPKNSVGTKQLKNNAVVSSKVKNRSLLAVDFKAGQLPQGPKGDKGDAGAPGAPGQQGVQGVPGEAVAYATVNEDGTIEAAQSKNITAAMVTHPSTGVYCFRNLGFTATSAIASGDNANDANNTLATAFVWLGFGIGGCDLAAGDRVRVRTVLSDTAALADRKFYIWLER